jgi:hypothetical protein
MKIMPRLLLLAIFLSSCGGPEIWIPQGSPRAAVTMAHVQYLESPPQRAHIVIGIITPKIGEYETLAEAVKVIRKEAAKRGADAVYIESQTKEGDWQFSIRPEGESFSEMTFRAKAIVWK